MPFVTKRHKKTQKKYFFSPPSDVYYIHLWLCHWKNKSKWIKAKNISSIDPIPATTQSPTLWAAHQSCIDNICTMSGEHKSYANFAHLLGNIFLHRDFHTQLGCGNIWWPFSRLQALLKDSQDIHKTLFATLPQPTIHLSIQSPIACKF